MNQLRIGIVAIFLALVFLAPAPDRLYLAERSLESLLPRVAEGMNGAAPGTIELSLSGLEEERSGPIAEEARARLVGLLVERGIAPVPEGPPLRSRILVGEKETRVFWSVGDGAEREAAARHLSWIALLPPFTAILIALILQRTIPALFLGVWLGATLLRGFNPLLGLWAFLRVYLVEEALLDSFRIEIIGFVIGLVALVGIISKGGGVQGMIGVMMRWVRSRRSAQMVTFGMGLVIFFDDYANTILVGSTMRPLTDRFRVSREKLAYLVDSTAAPVAGLSLLSTWIAYEVSQFAPQIAEVGITENPYMVFARTIPYRFYSIFTLLFILSGILLRREYGPMLDAENRSRTTGAVIDERARPMVSDAMTRIAAKEGIPLRWWNAALPLVSVVLVTLIGLWVTGNRALEEPKALSQVFSLVALRDVIAAASSTQAIAAGAWTGFFLAAALLLGQRILSAGEILRASYHSTKGLFFAILILLLAWCIGGVCRDIGTAHYLVALFHRSLSPHFYPIILFILSCLVSFSTGSSWSTMAIILPNSVTLAWILGDASPLGAFGLTVLSIGAVLEGSIFGDHCSPISDTTILSSVSSASDHIDHVRTQIPYAITSMLVAIVVGYFPSTQGVSPAITIPAGLAVLIGILLIRGKRPASDRSIDAGAGQST
ncbi:MAG: Na+/H+ antiporter NhaC family protein [Candidatus Eisenbacteria bacterium]|nr:Na+/H+ antiporter NhaC family protein [Candidatus Eisenbacteria bacterium]